MKCLSPWVALSVISLAMSGCDTPPGTEAGGGAGQVSTAAQANTAAGTAVDAQGRPLADVTVDVDGKATANGGIVSYDPATGPDGRYRQTDLTPGTYRVLAWKTVTYNGQTYKVPLMPKQGRIDDDFLSREGIARDFVWKISGPIPSRAFEPDEAMWYYGGSVTINGTDKVGKSLSLPEGTIVKGQLVPDGPLMDGSAGQAIAFEFPFKSGLYLHEQRDVPLGRYTLSLSADGQPIRLHSGSGGFEDTDYRPSATVEFVPSGAATRPYQTNFVTGASFNTRL